MAKTAIMVQHGDKVPAPGDPGLTVMGRRQAEETASWLKRHYAGATVWSSPLARAWQTALPIGRALNAEVRADDRLRERMNWDDPQLQTLEQFQVAWARTTRDRTYAPQNGDSSHDAGERAENALQSVLEDRANEVVLVSHGGVTVDLLRTLMGDDALELAHPGLMIEGVPSCGLTVLKHRDGMWTTIRVASTEHLSAPSAHRVG